MPLQRRFRRFSCWPVSSEELLRVADFIRVRIAVAPMPSELKSKEQFKKFVENAVEVRVVRKAETAKVKIRTKKTLHTFKTTAEEADALVKGLKVPVVEF